MVALCAGDTDGHVGVRFSQQLEVVTGSGLVEPGEYLPGAVTLDSSNAQRLTNRRRVSGR